MGGTKSREKALSDAVLGKLQAELAKQRAAGPGSYPVAVKTLFELAGEPAAEAAMRALVNPRAARFLRVTAKERRPDIRHYEEALAFLPDDVEGLADHPALLQHALRRLRTERTNLFTPTEVVEALPTFIAARFKAALKRRLEANQLDGVGAVRRNGHPYLFLLEEFARPRSQVTDGEARLPESGPTNGSEPSRASDAQA